MAKIVVVTSGKGGVGKTTTSASFASGLALRGFKTAVIDFDIGLRNLDISLGMTDRAVNLIEDGCDAVLRVGQLGDSSLVARTLGQLDFVFG